MRILQETDIAYQQQLEASNQTILQLQDQMNGGQSSFDEHEGFEFGELDDETIMSNQTAG